MRARLWYYFKIGSVYEMNYDKLILSANDDLHLPIAFAMKTDR